MSAPDLDALERLVVGYLLADWQRLFHVTTIPQALHTLGKGADPRTRWRLATHLGARLDALPPVQRWGLPHFVLTEAEKTLGRHLVASGAAGVGRAPVASLAADLGQTPEAVAVASTALARVGLLDCEQGESELSWRFRLDWRERLGPLGFTWHTLVRAGGERFGVP